MVWVLLLAPLEPKANGAGDDAGAASEALAPKPPPKGLPAGVVDPDDCPNENPADFSAAGVAGAPKAGVALLSAAGVELAPKENEALGVSAGLAAAGAPKENGAGLAEAAGVGVVEAG